MNENINTGTILIKEGTFLPECLHLETEPYSKGWGLVKHLDARGLDRKIREAGWTLFFMANEVNGNSICGVSPRLFKTPRWSGHLLCTVEVGAGRRNARISR